jgi:hypothetical protein
VKANQPAPATEKGKALTFFGATAGMPERSKGNFDFQRVRSMWCTIYGGAAISECYVQTSGAAPLLRPIPVWIGRPIRIRTNLLRINSRRGRSLTPSRSDALIKIIAVGVCHTASHAGDRLSLSNSSEASRTYGNRWHLKIVQPVSMSSRP